MKIITITIVFILTASIATSQELDTFAAETAKLNVFIIQSVSKTEMYVGESFVCDYTLLINSNITLTNVTLLQAPSFLPFKVKEVILPNAKNNIPIYTDTLIDNLPFKKAVLHRYFLTPKNAGTLTLEPIEFSLGLTLPLATQYQSQLSSDHYDYTYVLQSTPNKKWNGSVNVKSLPLNAKTPVFVGDFEIDWSVSNVTAKRNESIMLSVNINGVGDLSVPFVPEIAKMAGLLSHIYKTSDTSALIHNEIVSQKTYEVDLSSSTASEYVIQPIKILCFSPTRNDFYYLQTDAIPIFFIDEEQAVNEDGTFNILYIGVVIVILALIAFFVVAYRLVRRNNLSGKQKPIFSQPTNTFASDVSVTYLVKAMQAMSQDTDTYLKEISLAINDYIGDRFQIDTNTTDKNSIAEKLVISGVPQNIADNYITLNNKIEEVRFSQTDASNINKQALLDFVDVYINELEKYV
jgi:hypothetical protein